MARLAEDCLQVVDGAFTGSRDGGPVLSLEAVDSSFWIVRATDRRVLDRVRRAFGGVEDYDDTPHRD